jgi:hypothetical protein
MINIITTRRIVFGFTVFILNAASSDAQPPLNSGAYRSGTTVDRLEVIDKNDSSVAVKQYFNWSYCDSYGVVTAVYTLPNKYNGTQVVPDYILPNPITIRCDGNTFRVHLLLYEAFVQKHVTVIEEIAGSTPESRTQEFIRSYSTPLPTRKSQNWRR